MKFLTEASNFTIHRTRVIAKLTSFPRASAHSSPEEQLPPSFADEEPTESKLPTVNRDKSRLYPQHKNVLMDRRPYDGPAESWIHNTEKYQRSMFGRYGLASKVDPRICFPTQKDVELRAEYERVAYPHTIKDMIEIEAKAQKEERMKVIRREEDIAKKLEKLEQWKQELNTKVAKKEADAKAAKDRKDRLIEEVRRHFGFKIDPRDERFKELLEKKEKEDRKQQKEAKRKAKEDKMLSKIVEKKKTEAEQ